MIRILIMRHVFRVRTPATTRYCVVLDEGHNSPMEWATQGLPGGLQSKKDSKKEKAKVWVEVWNEV